MKENTTIQGGTSERKQNKRGSWRKLKEETKQEGKRD
jgi:hypothetical protein